MERKEGVKKEDLNQVFFTRFLGLLNCFSSYIKLMYFPFRER